MLTHLFYVLNNIKKTEVQDDEMKRIIHSVIKKDARSQSGDGILHMVISKNNTMKSNTFIEDPHTVIFPDANVTELLLECGAPVDAVNQNGSTALHVACTRSNYKADVVAVLLRLVFVEATRTCEGVLVSSCVSSQRA